MIKMIDNKNKNFDLVGLIIELVVFSLALPFTLFLMSVLGELANEFYRFLLSGNQPYLFYGTSISVGIGLKIWRDKRKKE